jgi:hypothetical protein
LQQAPGNGVPRCANARPLAPVEGGGGPRRLATPAPYTYASDNPENESDPSGLCSRSSWPIICDSVKKLVGSIEELGVPSDTSFISDSVFRTCTGFNFRADNWRHSSRALVATNLVQFELGLGSAVQGQAGQAGLQLEAVQLPTHPAGVVSQHLVSVGAGTVAPSACRFLPVASLRP